MSHEDLDGLIPHEELIGMCPKCSEWTTVAESCCGSGAIVNGWLVKEEDLERESEE